MTDRPPEQGLLSAEPSFTVFPLPIAANSVPY
jgi:hypothetical protein